MRADQQRLAPVGVFPDNRMLHRKGHVAPAIEPLLRGMTVDWPNARLQRMNGTQSFDLLLVLLVETFEKLDRVIGVQLSDAFRDGLRLELFEDFLADGVVNFVERRKMEIGTGQFHQPDAIIRIERGDQITEIGFVEFSHHGAQKRRVVSLDCARHLIDEFAANFAVLPAHREAVEHRVAGNVHLFGHGVPRRFDRMIQVVLS